MEKDKIIQILRELLPKNEEGNVEKKVTVEGTYHVGQLSGNRLNSGTLKSQIIICNQEVWNKSDAKNQIHSDQRVFVQTGDDVWDIYKGGALDTESKSPQQLYTGVKDLKKLIEKELSNLKSQKSSSSAGSILTENPLQQIFYGAPGTGKSYEINERTKGKDVIRTTFHPDSDYSTFVGCYKPIMGAPKPIYGFDSKGNTVKVTDLGEEVPEQKIEYKFVKQAFLKAYIKAWKSFVLSQYIGSPQSSQLSLTNKKDTWIIHSMDDEYAYYTKESTFLLKDYEKNVKKCWNNIVQSDDPDQYQMSNFERYEATACFWYLSLDNHSVSDSEDDCWSIIYDYLSKGNVIEYTPGSQQSYKVQLRDNSVVVISKNKAKKITIKGNFGKQEKRGSVQSAIATKLQEYDDNFEDAWAKMMKNNGLAEQSSFKKQFLVIEEINRGNCAQIFGDLFQLLDRNKNGFSEYFIESDTDIQRALLVKETVDELSFGEKGLQFTADQLTYINSQYDKDGQQQNVAERISKGQVLVLPPNLYIWATMNTSDQSLFPMDSAFKRRWDWKCIPIDYKNEKSKNFTITINGKKYNWHDFLKEVNQRILKATGSEDKQMGNFFIKGDVDEKQFINKVMFYLWNDVCKEEYGTNNNFFRYYKDSEKKETEQFTFNKLFESDAKYTLSTLSKFMEFLAVYDEETKKKKSESKEATELPAPEPVPES